MGRFKMPKRPPELRLRPSFGAWLCRHHLRRHAPVSITLYEWVGDWVAAGALCCSRCGRLLEVTGLGEADPDE